jgi:CTP synthase
VIEGKEVKSIYEVPLVLDQQKMGAILADRLKLEGLPDTTTLKNFIHRYRHPARTVTIAMCGKYTELPDAYKSVLEAFIHAGVENNARVNLTWIATEGLRTDQDTIEAFKDVDGILLLPGFGSRGSEGKIRCARYAREHQVPYLGICLGLQCAVIDFARQVCGLPHANSTEFDKHSPNPVIDLMESQRAIRKKGGTMRLGAYDCEIKPGTKAYAAYRKKRISERHRHRWEVNNRYRARLENAGMVISGINPDLNLVEIIELRDHPWFVATQFHPELKSRVTKAHPLFREFVRAAVDYSATD